jgi:hypothetical protein
VLGVGVGGDRDEAEMKSKSYLCTPLEASRQRPILVPPADLGSDTDQPTGYGKREVSGLSAQRHDLAKDRFTSISSRVVLGRISTSWPRWRTPVRIEPPTTLPFRSSTSAPGMLTSKDRMTTRRGSEKKSRIGMGDAIDGVFVDGANVVFQLGRYAHDERRICNGA